MKYGMLIYKTFNNQTYNSPLKKIFNRALKMKINKRINKGLNRGLNKKNQMQRKQFKIK